LAKDAANRPPISDQVCMNALAGLALFLIVVWLVLKIALEVTSGLLHLIWIAAVVMLIVWAVGKLRGGSSGA